jgi:glycosyltransferase involved in cell wall biosynthesis
VSPAAVGSVHVIVPEGIDDSARPSGGNTYDRRICQGLAAIGWSVHEQPVPGSWPTPDAAARTALTGVIAGIPDGAVVLVDGLIASTVPAVLVPETGRLRLVVLVHMPLGAGPSGAANAHAQECAVLSAAAAVVTTSTWTRSRLVDDYALPPGRVHVAEPGVDAADLAAGTADGGQLLCVAAVTPHKGHDVLLAALATVTDLPWSCVCVGTLQRDPGFASRLRRQAREGGIAARVRFSGAQTGHDLDRAYVAADVLVLASRTETYGMVVTEALARGLPVVATAVGGLPDALGRVADGSRPGLLVAPDDPAVLGAALRCWLSDAGLRQRLRRAAGERRLSLSDWSSTTRAIAHVLSEAAA